jgi:hypothetical protein
MNVYKVLVVHKGTMLKSIMSVGAKNITHLKKRLSNLNYNLVQVIE